MSDECRIVQEAISRAADGDRVTAQEAAHAKAHCAACTECAAFVSTLVALKRTPAPAAPETTVQRALDAVAAETAAAARAAQAEAETRAAAETQAAASAASLTAAGTPAAGETVAEGAPILAPIRHRNSPAAVAGWIAGAAAVLFVAMLVTAQGLRYIGGQDDMSADKGTVVAERYAVDSTDGQATGESLAAEAPTNDASLTALNGSRYVTYEGYAYRFVSEVEVDPANLPRLGSVTTALASGSAPIEHRVFQGDAIGRIVVDDEGTALSFELVTREFEGTQYGLRSEQIDAFGQWPTMPSNIPQPSDADGGPTFIDADEYNGVTLYTRPGKDSADGFAIAPGTPQTDPAASNPEWTWWEPLP